jgi:hypothetical protein
MLVSVVAVVSIPTLYIDLRSAYKLRRGLDRGLVLCVLQFVGRP